MTKFRFTTKTLVYMNVVQNSYYDVSVKSKLRSRSSSKFAAKLSFPSRDQVSRFWDKLFGKDDEVAHHVDEAEFIFEKKLRYDDMDSSMVHTVEYNPDEKAMLVGFRSDNALYMFYNVNEWIFDRIVNAQSHGKMFWRLIRRSNTKYKRIR